MLEKKDFEQIRTIVREETKQVVKDEVNYQITAEIPAIIENKIFPLKRDLRIIREKIEQIWQSETEDVNAIVELFEKFKKDFLVLQKRVEKLEIKR